MPESKNRFVLLSRQLLAVGTVAALLAPAAGVVTLNIVAPTEQATRQATQQATPQADPPPAPSPRGLVATKPVAPDVEEVQVHGVEKAGLRALSPRAADRVEADQDVAALTAPTPVQGVATVGVTWSSREHLADGDVSVTVRTLDHGEWSAWQQIPYDADHGPDPDSEEAAKARPGTDPIVVGDVDKVQVKVETSDGEVPADTQLALVDPKATPAPKVEPPAIDTAKLPAENSVALSAATAPPDETATGAGEAVGAGRADAVLSSGARVTPKPQIFSRAQWGADEKLRDKSSLHYYEVHAGFVHHTVNANGYTRAQVPALLRGIYAYHTQTKGWSDIGYNFIVDRFGRIWEGRYGGVDRPVVGAHTLNYNENSFAMSALGNFETGQPSSAMLDAYARLFAWKLSLHGVSASSTRQWVGSRYFQAINGHRDAGTTACPGRYLYAKLGTIRALAAKYEVSFDGRVRTTDLAGSRWPDLVVRDKASKEAYVVRTGGQTDFERSRRLAAGWGGMDLIAAARDLTGDGVPDVVARNRSTLVTSVYPGTSRGGLGSPVLNTARFESADQIAGVLDMTGDGRNDVIARLGTAKRLWLFPGNGHGGFRVKRKLADSWSAYNLTTGVGDLNGDGHNDLVARDAGRLYLVPGTGRGIAEPVLLGRGWGRYSIIAGAGDLTNDRIGDVLVKDRSSGLVYVYPGDRKGRLGTPIGPFSQFKAMSFIAATGRLAGNRAVDLLVRDGSGNVDVYSNNGRKNVEAVTDTGFKLGASNLLLNVGDWNGDGYGDLMTRTRRTGNMYLRLGDGRGGFGGPILVAKGWGGVRLLAAVGDMTGDGSPDLMGQPSGGAMRIYPGDGGTGFLGSYVAHSAITANRHTGVGLWKGDGAPDSLFRRSDGTLQLYEGNGPGGLMNPTKVGSGLNSYDWLQAVGDATGDNRPDLLVRESATGKLWLLPRSGSGFGARRLVAAGFDAYDLSS